jgi:hypothetical protein
MLWESQDIMKSSRKAKTQTQEDIEGDDKGIGLKAKETRKSFKCHVRMSCCEWMLGFV